MKYKNFIKRFTSGLLVLLLLLSDLVYPLSLRSAYADDVLLSEQTELIEYQTPPEPVQVQSVEEAPLPAPTDGQSTEAPSQSAEDTQVVASDVTAQQDQQG